MQRYPGRNRWRWLIVLATSGLSACAPSGGGGGGDENGGSGGGGIGGGDGPISGGFDEGGLPEPEALPADVVNIPPTGSLLFPAAEVEVAIGDVVFLWEGTDANGTTLDNTVYVSDQAAVFDEPIVTQGVRTSADETEHRLSIQFPEAGSFFWGVEITDGVNTARLPADGQGLPFAVSASSTIRIGLDDAILVCPGSAFPARSVTTFRWSLGEALPTRTQIFVSRSGVANPFEAPLRVFEVDTPTDTSYALTEADALTVGDELSWGLRIETADEVLFTFAGQIGESFAVADNVPPSGQLLGPENEFILADDAVLTFDLVADPENCEDELALTFALEFLGTSSEPDALFDSETQVTATAETAPAELAAFLDSVDLVAGRWAWGVLASDRTDQTALPDADDPGRTYRTFIRDTGPRFVVDPVAATQACAQGSRDVIDGAVVGQGLAFFFEDGNGAETVTVTVTYAANAADVFDAPEATLVLEGVPAGTDPVEVVIFLEALEPSECVEFVHGLGFYGVELDDGVNNPVQQAAEYLGPPTGACCSSDGFCEDLVEDACTHGIYQGNGTSCSTFECPILTGACCLPDGSCTDELEDGCVLLKGTHQGTGTQCAATDCPILIGACCLSDGSCTDGVIESCFGTFQGTGTTCATIGCPPPPPTVFDCNSNGVPDDQDIASGFSHDCDLNGIPDECEDVGNVVDAGTLKLGTIIDGVYDSASDNNDLQGFICPVLSPQSVRWSTVSVPPGGTNAFIIYTNQSSLTTAFSVGGAIAGDYVIRLDWIDLKISDTVTLTLQAEGPL